MTDTPQPKTTDTAADRARWEKFVAEFDRLIFDARDAFRRGYMARAKGQITNAWLTVDAAEQSLSERDARDAKDALNA